MVHLGSGCGAQGPGAGQAALATLPLSGFSARPKTERSAPSSQQAGDPALLKPALGHTDSTFCCARGCARHRGHSGMTLTRSLLSGKCCWGRQLCCTNEQNVSGVKNNSSMLGGQQIPGQNFLIGFVWEPGSPAHPPALENLSQTWENLAKESRTHVLAWPCLQHP